MNLPPLRRSLALAAVALATCAAAADPAPLAWLGSTEVATGRGERGPWRQNDSRYDYVDDPAVAIDERGNAVVAWVDQALKDVLVQRLPDGTGKPPPRPVNVSRNPATFSWLPRLAVAPDAPQRIHLLWQEIIFSGGSHGGDILYARSEDGGASFSAPVNLSASRAGDGKGRINREVWHNGSLDLVAGPGGLVHAAWTEYEGTLWFARSDDGGRSFSRPRRIAGGQAEPARAPSLAQGPDGAVYLAWTVGENPRADIRLARSPDGGASFEAPRRIAPSRGYSDAPKLAVDAAGALHLAWAESAGGPFDRYRVRYARSLDGGRRFETARDVSPAGGAAQSASFPALAVDARGRVYVMWEMFPDHRRRPRGLALAVSPDGGRSFDTPRPVPDSADPAGGSNGSHQGLLTRKLAVSSRGEVAIVNSSLREDERSRVWLMRAAPPPPAAGR